jgi:hypothetical protein
MLLRHSGKWVQCKSDISSYRMTFSNMSHGGMKATETVCKKFIDLGGSLALAINHCCPGEDWQLYRSVLHISGTIIKRGSCHNCPSGQSGLGKGAICKDKCPKHLFNFADYGTNLPIGPAMSGSEGSHLLEFSDTSTDCLNLPGPSGATKVPTEFTISMWIYAGSGWSGNRVLIWGFNAFPAKHQLRLPQIINSLIFGFRCSITLPTASPTDWALTPVLDFVSAVFEIIPPLY